MFKQILFHCDIETGGLNGRLPNGEMGEQFYPILEVAVVLTDTELNTIGEPLRIAIHHCDEVIGRCGGWSIEKHSASGLLNDVRSSKVTTKMAEQQILEHLIKHGGRKFDRETKTGVVMVGNSITLDRVFINSQMPLLGQFLHYRQLDITSLTLAAQFWNEAVSQEAVAHKKYLHQAIPDIQESISELRIFRSMFKAFESAQA